MRTRSGMNGAVGAVLAVLSVSALPAMAQSEKPAGEGKAAQPEKPAPAKPEPKAEPKAEPKSEPKSADPAVEEIIKEMQKPAAGEKGAGVKAVDAKPVPGGATGAKPAAGVGEAARVRPADQGKGRVVREGTFIVSRKGRLVKSASGEWVFAFESDAQQKAGVDPAMNMLPCEKLMAMERVAEKHGEAVTYTVTGQVFVYHGKNYLMPTNYVVNRPSGDVKPLQ